MLAQLSVRNVVLIERLELALAPGFNVVTGETGAGKSILVDALSLVLGGRARPELVRSGADEAEVEALFELQSPARGSLAGIDSRRRAFRRAPSSWFAAWCRGSRTPERADGAAKQETRSRAYINGRLCTAAQLADLGVDLCDIASQHESVSLDGSVDPRRIPRRVRQARGRADEARGAGRGFGRRRSGARGGERAGAGAGGARRLPRWQLREIDELDAHEGEETELERERARLRHAERLAGRDASRGRTALRGEAAICDELGRLGAEIDQAAAIDGSLWPHARVVESARAELTDAARALRRYAEGVEASPERLAEVEERAFRLQKLLRKHGPTTSELLAHRATLAAELRVARERVRSPGDARRGEGRADRRRGGGRAHAVPQAP